MGAYFPVVQTLSGSVVCPWCNEADVISVEVPRSNTTPGVWFEAVSSPVFTHLSGDRCGPEIDAFLFTWARRRPLTPRPARP